MAGGEVAERRSHPRGLAFRDLRRAGAGAGRGRTSGARSSDLGLPRAGVLRRGSPRRPSCVHRPCDRRPGHGADDCRDRRQASVLGSGHRPRHRSFIDRNRYGASRRGRTHLREHGARGPSSFTATSHIRPSGASTIVYGLDISSPSVATPWWRRTEDAQKPVRLFHSRTPDELGERVVRLRLG
jgi:hypothetical protein